MASKKAAVVHRRQQRFPGGPALFARVKLCLGALDRESTNQRGVSLAGAAGHSYALKRARELGIGRESDSGMFAWHAIGVALGSNSAMRTDEDDGISRARPTIVAPGAGHCETKIGPKRRNDPGESCPGRFISFGLGGLEGLGGVSAGSEGLPPAWPMIAGAATCER